MIDRVRDVVAEQFPGFENLLSGVRFGQFLSVGVVGLAFDTMVLFLLTDVASVAPVPAKLASAETSIVVMFLLNEQWTFSRWGESTAPELGRRLIKSNVVRVGGVAVATTVMYVLYNWFGVWPVLGNFVGVGAGFVVNYLFESLFTWRVHLE